MFGYFLFGLTITAYIGVSAYALQPHHSGGSDAAYGSAIAGLAVIVAFILTSLFLTIYMTVQGGFNWISDTVMKRNIGIAILWLGVVAGVVFCTLGHIEYHKYYQLTGFARLLSYIIYYGATWLPLLMLIPYFLFLKPEWRETLSPNLFKIPSLVGFLLLITPKIVSSFFSSYRKFDAQELAFSKAMESMKKYPSVSSLLYYTGKGTDEQVRRVALAKIKASKNLEAELIATLEQSSPATCFQVYAFLDDNKTEHPERFIEPIVKSFPKITAEIHELIVNPYKGGMYPIEVLLRVLEGQFKDSIAVFKPHILKLQEILETPPAKSREYDDVQECNDTLNKYRLIVKNWLDSH
jgi:hypothetical protein